MNRESDVLLSPAPLFVTRKGKTTIIHHGGFQRWKAIKIAALELHWNWRWQVRYDGEILTQQVFGNLASEKSTYLAFKGVSGQLVIAGAVNASVRVSRKEAGSYTLQMADIKNGWEVFLAALGPPGQVVKVEISCNGVKVIAAPSSHETWSEGVCSVGGFVRHKWGDWLLQSSDTLPVPAKVACLCSVALHNSVLGDLLISKT